MSEQYEVNDNDQHEADCADLVVTVAVATTEAPKPLRPPKNKITKMIRTSNPSGVMHGPFGCARESNVSLYF